MQNTKDTILSDIYNIKRNMNKFTILVPKVEDNYQFFSSAYADFANFSCILYVTV